MSYKDKSYLIIDDMKVCRNILKDVLENFGVSPENIHQAFNGKDAIKKLDAIPIDLIICDWNMPEMNGLDFLKYCKSSEYFMNKPFFMLTAEADKENIVEAMDLGITAYLLKPIQKDQLFSKIISLF